MSIVRGLPRTFRDGKAILAESLVWDAEAGDLLWCDITLGLLHRSPFHTSTDTSISVAPPLASFSPAIGGGYVASLGDRVVLIDADGRITATLAKIEHAHAGFRMNEGKVDPAGRWVSGSMNLTTGERDGAIYSVTSDGASRVLIGGLATSNGFEWSLSGSLMYFGDTGAQTIFVGEYTADGDLEHVRPFHTGEMHDGLAIDEDGFLWSGIYGGGRVIRYSPDGEEDLIVEFPAPNITSVAFGGPDRSTLFAASARENLTEDELVRHPLSGAVFAVETTTHGKPSRWFG